MSLISTITVGDLLAEDRGISVGVMYPGEHDPSGVPLIRAGDIQDSVLNSKPEFRVSQAVHHEYRRTKLDGGEVLMSLVGKPGQCVLVPPSMSGWNAARAIAVIRLRDLTDAPYFRYACHAPDTQYTISAWCNTTVQPTLNLKEIRALPIAWPSKAMRTAIASILGALDDKIELNRRMNETLEELTRTIFKSWFVDFDPVKAKANGQKPEGMDAETAALFPSRFVESELGMIPEGWPLGTVEEVVYLQRGFDITRTQQREGNIPVVSSSGIHSYHAEAMVSRPGLVIGRKGSLGTVFLLREAHWPHDTTLWAKDLRGYPVLFTFYFLRELRLERLDVGSVNPTLNRNHVHPIPAVVPPIPTTNQFVAAVSPFQQNRWYHEDQSQTLVKFRDSLLPKLISGELRVPDAEKLAEAVL